MEQREPVVVGIVASPGAARDVADQLAEDLPGELGRHFGADVAWRAEVRETAAAHPAATSGELIEAVRRRLLEEGWELAIGLTDLPLRAGRHPVSAQASATHGVGLLSVPALGAVGVRRRARAAVVRLIEALLGEEQVEHGGTGAGARHARMRVRVRELASPLGRADVRDDGTVRFVGATLRRNLRLLVGMVRANEPSRVVTRLSAALVAALGTGAFAIATSDIWNISQGMSWPRLAALALGSIIATTGALIVAHGLWERAADPAARERVVLFNLATAATVTLGVLVLYGALLALTAACAAALIAPSTLAREVGHPVDVTDYVQLALLAASLATIGGALGSLVESDIDVRDAAYRSWDDAGGGDEEARDDR
jgi:putative flippase GtrA